MSRPRALDLFCGAGGASMGLYRAGYDVTGVDIKPQPRYPFAFVQADAMTYPLDGGWDLIWASPPCQAHSTIAKQNRKRHPGRYNHPDLVGATRDRLIAAGVPYIIENVIGAPLLNGSVILCGSSFALDVRRHRVFESSFVVMAPECRHKLQTGQFRSLDKRRACKPASVVGVHGHINYAGEMDLRSRAMGIDWMDNETLTQAIPPAYAEFIAKQAPR